MGRPKQPWPPKLGTKAGEIRVWWNGRWHTCGRVDPATGEASAAAKAEYARFISAWKDDPGAVPLDPNEYLVAELYRDFMASAECPPPGKQRERVAAAMTLLCERFGSTPAAGFTVADLEAWARWLGGLPSAKHPGRTRFNVTTIKIYAGVVRTTWQWAVRHQRVTADRWHELKAAKLPRDARPPTVVEPADPAAVRASLPFLRPPVRAMAVLEWHTGGRPGELCRMKVGDVVRSGTIRVKGAGAHDLDALGVWAYAPDAHKTAKKGKPRVLLFGPDVWPTLAPFLDGRDPAEFVFRPADSMADLRREQQEERAKRCGGSGGNRKKPTGPPRVYNPHYTPGGYRLAVERAAERAGVERWYPYQLRHLAAAEVKVLFNLDGVQALLGHHSRSMAEHYGGNAVKKAAEVAKGRKIDISR